MRVDSWQVTLLKCPYCDKELNISSLTTRSERESVGNVIVMSKIHLEKCRLGKQKKLSDIKIKEIQNKNGYESIIYKSHKILS